MNDPHSRDTISQVIDDLEKTILVTQAAAGDRRPLADLHNLAVRLDGIETMLLGVLFHPKATEEDLLAVGKAFGRLCEIDYYGHSFDELVKLAEAAENN
jgi:hypothetical protein